MIWAMSAGDREAEAQAKKGEEGTTPDPDSRAAAALKQYWCVGLRAVELVSLYFKKDRNELGTLDRKVMPSSHSSSMRGLEDCQTDE